MADGPWTKYQKQAATTDTASAPENSGPWTKYQKVAAPEQKDAHPETGLRDQTMSGVNEGIAGAIGMPIDAVAGAINGIGDLTGAWGHIERPVGGSQWLKETVLSPTISDVEPQTGAQRFGRRVGQEVGAAVVPMAGTMRGASTAAEMASRAAPQIASAVGGGIGAQTANEIAPDSPVAELAGNVIGSVAGGAVAGAIARRANPTPDAVPTTDALKSQASDLYTKGDARPGADPQSLQQFRQGIDDVLARENLITPTGRNLADGNVRKFLDVMDDYQGQTMTPRQMQTARKFLTDAAKSAEPSDRRIGAMLLDEFDTWRNQAVPEYAEADKLYGRLKRAEDIDWRVEKAENRAASTGTGGNTVNAARQNIRQILDNPKLRRGYSAEEIAAMEAIVRGDKTTNAMRLAGRLSPTSGAFPLIANTVGTSMNPLLGGAIAGAAAGAKGIAERRTSQQINALARMIRNGSPEARNYLTLLERMEQPSTNALAYRLGATYGQQ